jgi:predicted aspartyl protease
MTGFLLCGMAWGCGTALPVQGQAASAERSTEHSTAMDQRYGKPYVMVTINGRGPYRFILDTGTGGEVLITPELAAELALPATGKATLSDPSGEGSKKVPIVLIDTLELAGVQFSTVEAVEHTLNAEAGQADGLLGFALFRDYLLTLDFPNRRVRLSTGELTTDGEKTVLPFSMVSGVPVMQLRLSDDVNVQALLDSGGAGLEIPEQVAARLKYDVDPVVFAVGRSICTTFQIKSAKLGTDVKLGRYTFTHPVVQIHSAFPEANFGSWAMRGFAITFDQENQLVRFESAHDTMNLGPPPSPPHFINQAHQQQAADVVPVD